MEALRMLALYYLCREGDIDKVNRVIQFKLSVSQ